MTAPKNKPAFDAAALVALGRVGAVAVSPCGTWLAVEVARVDGEGARYRTQLWRVEVDGDTAAPPIPLTRGPSESRAPCFRRDGALGFLSDRDPREDGPSPGSGDDSERAQVWLLPARGGEPRPLTDEPLGVEAFRFAEAGDRLVVVAPVLLGVPHEEQRKHHADREKNGPSALRYRTMNVRHWNHWLPPEAPHFIAYGPEGEGRRDLTPLADREHREAEWDLSPAGDRVVTTVARLGPDRIHDTALRLIDTATGDIRDVWAAPRVTHEGPRFDPSGQRVACARHTRRDDAIGAPRLWLYDLAAATDRPVAPDWDAWLKLAGWTPDGAGLLVTADDAGRVPIYRVDLETDRVDALIDATAGGCHDHVRALPDGRTLVGVRHTLLHPPEPFRAELSPGASPEPLASLSGFRAEEGAAVATVESFEVEAEDGERVQSFLVRSGDGAPLPALIWIHGGPIGQHVDGWHWRWNPLVPAAAGYAVVLPNPRGSTGRGQAFVEGIWGNAWGAAPYTDLLAVTDAVEAREDIDGGRVAAMGGSFGGYMTNWIGAQTDRFRCLVTHAGIFSFPGFYGQTDYPAWIAHEMGTTPHDAPEAFARCSPHRLLDGWRSPTLIIHGEKDYRCPIGDALALFEALQLREVPSELLVFPDEGHWILKPRNIRAWYGMFLEFLARYV